MKKLMRGFLCGILLVALTFGSVGCSTNKDEKATASVGGTKGIEETKATAEVKPGEKTTIQFLYIWPEWEAVMNKTISAFEELNPDIKVEVSAIPWDKVRETLQIKISADQAPDVSFMWTGEMGNYDSIGAVLDLTPYLEADQAWKNNFSSDQVLAPGTVNGKVLSVPFRGGTQCIAYNKDLFDKNGWTEATDMDQFEKLMAEIKASGISPFAIAGKPDGFLLNSIKTHLIENMLLADGTMKDPEYLLGRKVDIEAPYIEAAKKMREWLNSGYFGEYPLAVAREEAQSAFFNEMGAMILINTNEYADLIKNSKFNLGFMQLPPPEGAVETVTPAGFDGFFAYSGTKYPDQAVALLKYLTSTEVQQMWADEAASTMIAKGITYKDANIEKMAEWVSWVKPYIVKRDYNPGNVDAENDKSFVEFLLNDSITPEELAKTWNENTKQAIKDSQD